MRAVPTRCHDTSQRGKQLMNETSLLARDHAHLIHSLNSSQAHDDGHVWVKGEGAYLFDSEGRRFIDALSGLWNVVSGHGRPELVEAATKQLKTLAYCSTYAGSSNARVIELAERLAFLTYPSINRFFFTSGGAEATETSIKTARSFWNSKGQPEKNKVISRQWGYHGTTLAALSCTGISPYWPQFEPRVQGVSHIPSPYPYRYEENPDELPGRAAADELEKEILRQGPDTVAMFLAEPVQGAGGVIVPPDGYFPRIREICDLYNVLLVADEVITGFGRTGKLFALDHWNVEPDIVQFAKAITSGYFPLGGIGVNNEIAETLFENQDAWMHAFTYSGHPVGCAIAMRNLDLIETENFLQQATDKGNFLANSLRARLSDHAHVGEVRGLGLMCAIEFVQDKTTKQEFPAEATIGPKIQQAAADRGLFSRLRGDVFCLAPPIISSRTILEEIINIMSDSVREVLG